MRKKLSKKINIFYFSIGLIYSILVLGIAFFIAVFHDFETEESKIIFMIISLIYFAVTCIPGLIIPFFVYKTYSYEINDEFILIKKGVIFVTELSVPIRNIRHVTKERNIYADFFKIAGVRFSTTGSSDMIFGLNTDEADNIIAYLENKIKSL